jgi:lipopolysaccharide-induced tumor necrosis factor-alpha factor
MSNLSIPETAPETIPEPPLKPKTVPEYEYRTEVPATVYVPYMQPQMIQPLLTEFPTETDCHYCHAHIHTQVTYESGALTWLMCILIGFLCICFAWIPFVVDSLKDAVHSCPNCKQVIGKYSRL